MVNVIWGLKQGSDTNLKIVIDVCLSLGLKGLQNFFSLDLLDSWKISIICSLLFKRNYTHNGTECKI